MLPLHLSFIWPWKDSYKVPRNGTPLLGLVTDVLLNISLPGCTMCKETAVFVCSWVSFCA